MQGGWIEEDAKILKAIAWRITREVLVRRGVSSRDAMPRDAYEAAWRWSASLNT